MSTQTLEFITDAELQAASGGGTTADHTNKAIDRIPYLGAVNGFSGDLGGPTIGGAVEDVKKSWPNVKSNWNALGRLLF